MDNDAPRLLAAPHEVLPERRRWPRTTAHNDDDNDEDTLVGEATKPPTLRQAGGTTDWMRTPNTSIHSRSPTRRTHTDRQTDTQADTYTHAHARTRTDTQARTHKCTQAHAQTCNHAHTHTTVQATRDTQKDHAPPCCRRSERASPPRHLAGCSAAAAARPAQSVRWSSATRASEHPNTHTHTHKQRGGNNQQRARTNDAQRGLSGGGGYLWRQQISQACHPQTIASILPD
jgi:hypothetical protein